MEEPSHVHKPNPDTAPLKPRSVGAPTELADREEVPTWFADLFKVITGGWFFIALLCGGVPTLCGIGWCIMTLFLG